jgi:hypothetical protein
MWSASQNARCAASTALVISPGNPAVAGTRLVRPQRPAGLRARSGSDSSANDDDDQGPFGGSLHNDGVVGLPGKPFPETTGVADHRPRQ